MGDSKAMPVRLLFAVSCAALFAAIALAVDLAGPSRLIAATGRADVRLVRLLDEVPDAERARLGPVHDVRVRLVSGNVLVLKKGGDFAAILPIERGTSGPESLKYFYYLEHPSIFWVIPGSRDKGIRTVADGGAVSFNSFSLIWRGESKDVGWIYFPDIAENAALKFSVVSGQSVDDADPKDTKYWVELGAAGKSGF
jgi:hypothetical protein